MTIRMLIDAVHEEETRVIMTDERDRIDQFDFITTAKKQLKGNIYLAKITRIEPSLQAAFVEYGGDKQGFLSFSEIHPDYYQIPIEDRKKLIAEAVAEEKRVAAKEEAEDELFERKRAQERGRQRDEMEDNENENENQQEEQHSDTEGSVSDEAVDSDVEEKQEEDTAGDRPRRGRRRRYGRNRELSARQDRVSGSAEDEDSGDEQDDMRAETISEADFDEDPGKPHVPINRRYKIQEVIKSGQIVLVQVIKEERGNKGVSLSTFISLAGRYCVLMPNSPKEGGISRKISSHEDRKRLKKITSELKEKRGMSAIIRTAGIDRSRVEIKRDYEYLIKLWNQIRETALSSNAPKLVYEESDIIKRSIRDCYNSEVKEVLVEGENAYKAAKEFMKMIMPSHAARVKQFKETTPIFHYFEVEEQLQALHAPTARLRSGGYLVINPTEALISIDVNSGRQISERNVEETAFKTNLEAAEEVARQLKLRDLGGLIVIDFIDMNYGKHRRQVERVFKDALKADRAKIQASHISAFGLMELSRQRLGPNIYETTTVACVHCEGTGVVRAPESLAIGLLRQIRGEACEGDIKIVTITVSFNTALILLNQYRTKLIALEQEFGITIHVVASNDIKEGEYRMDARTAEGTSPRRRDEKGSGRGRGRRGGRGRGKRDDLYPGDEEEVVIVEEVESEDDEDENENEGDDRERGEPRERGRSRRRRGGRRRMSGERVERTQAADAATEADSSSGEEGIEKAPARPRRASRSHRDAHPIAHESVANEEPQAQPMMIDLTVDAESAEKPKRGRRKSVKEAGEKTLPEVVEEKAKDKPTPRAPRAKKEVTPVPSEDASSAAGNDNGKETGPKRRGWWNRVAGD